MASGAGSSERLVRLVAPVLHDLGLTLYDLEQGGGIVRVTVERPGGVDLDALAHATRLISRELDHADPLPGRYTLEVTSPGLERALRTPAHFAGAVGSIVAVRTHAHVEGDRRVQGVLVAADEDGCTVRLDEPPAGGPPERRLAYADVERARTVFVWGPSAGGGGKPGRGGRAGKERAGGPGAGTEHGEGRGEDRAPERAEEKEAS